MIIKLSKEYKLGSKKYTEINLDLENLSGNDILDCGRNYKSRAKNNAETFKDFEDQWALTVAEKATGIKYGYLAQLGAVDFLKIVNKTKNFLVKGWGTEEETENGEETPAETTEI